MKNLHLVPVNVQDLVEKINSTAVNDHERQNYIIRLEAIRDYCDMHTKSTNNHRIIGNKFTVKKHKR